jgi:hypothetical protein
MLKTLQWLAKLMPQAGMCAWDIKIFFVAVIRTLR